MRLFMIIFISLLTMNTTKAQFTPATDPLDDPRTTAEETWQKATDEARQIAAAYREASAAEQPDDQSIERLKSDLEAAVTKAFEAQTLLQTVRLQLAEENLQRVRAKLQRREKLSTSIIARRVERLQAGTASAESDNGHRMRRFESPEALFAEWNRCYTLRDFPGLISLMDDNAVSEQAGCLLPYASFIAATEFENYTEGYNAPLLELIKRHRRIKSSTQAQAAEAVLFQEMFEEGAGPDFSRLTSEATRRQFLLVSENIADPREFCFEFLLIFHQMTGKSTSPFPKPELGLPRWNISVADNVATATSSASAPQSTKFTSGTFQAMKNDSGWLIHSVFSPPIPKGGELIESPTLRYFETPAKLMAEWNRCSAAKDHDAMTSLMDENAAKELAGMYLFSVASAYTITQLVQASGTKQLDPGTEAIMSIIKIPERHRRTDPPPNAVLAYTQMSSQSVVMLVQSQNPIPPPQISAKKLYSQILDAADILADSRAFIVEIATAFEALESESKSDVPKTPQWKIDIDGKAAIATSQSGSSTSGYRLAQHEKGWIIHSVLS